jgi:transposase
MGVFVGLDVSLRTVSICVVEADGTVVWEGKALSEPVPLVERLAAWRSQISLVGIEACPLSDGFMAHLLEAVSIPCASRHGMRNGFYHRGPTRPTAAMRAASPT